MPAYVADNVRLRERFVREVKVFHHKVENP